MKKPTTTLQGYTTPSKEVDKSWIGPLTLADATISGKAPTFSSQDTRTRTRLSFPSSGTCTNPGSKEQECIITSCGVETNDAIRDGQKSVVVTPTRKFEHETWTCFPLDKEKQFV